ncbi:hypothetical protein BKA70DRAFT_1414432 [Coprinopsis sp. MPI-PUGE-AT-0042]|nr:hypothetical protein BKA70DRAFT_1414432 [Coprinopsis sp. MPI-PUGE-AT-0042]
MPLEVLCEILGYLTPRLGPSETRRLGTSNRRGDSMRNELSLSTLLTRERDRRSHKRLHSRALVSGFCKTAAVFYMVCCHQYQQRGSSGNGDCQDQYINDHHRIFTSSPSYPIDEDNEYCQRTTPSPSSSSKVPKRYTPTRHPVAPSPPNLQPTISRLPLPCHQMRSSTTTHVVQAPRLAFCLPMETPKASQSTPQTSTRHFSPALSSDAEKNGWPIHVSNQRSEALNFADNFFDLSIMNLAIFFSPNQGLDGAKEIYRILKPGGVGLVNCWEYIPWLIPFQSAYELVRAKKIPTGPLAVWHDGQHLQKVMRDAGFKQEDMKMERHEAWLEVKRQDLREWAEKIWAYMAGVAGWVEGDEEKWDQAVDTLTESLLVQPGTEITDDVVKMMGSQWVVVAKK